MLGYKGDIYTMIIEKIISENVCPFQLSRMKIIVFVYSFESD